MWETGWYRCHWYEAKVYGEGSVFGINKGRVSKLHIKKDEVSVYNYDRGLDFDELKDRGVLEHILSLYQEH